MTSIIVQQDEYKRWQEMADKIPVLSMLLGIRPDLDRYVDAYGNPVGTTELEAIQQVIVRDWETTRLRSAIWGDEKLSPEKKDELILALNLFESYIHTELKDDTIERKRLSLSYVIETLQNQYREEMSER